MDKPGRILHYLRQYHRQFGVAPSLREIAAACAIPSTSNVVYHLERLEKAGHLKRLAGLARGIVLAPATQPDNVDNVEN